MHAPSTSAASRLDISLSPAMTAGLLLWSRNVLKQLDLPHPSAAEVLRATRARPAQAYTRRARLHDAVTQLDRPSGRPRRPRANHDTAAITREVLKFVMNHPGAVHGSPARRKYSDGFRTFVVELSQRFHDLDRTAFAEAVGVPTGCVRAWQRDAQHAQQTTAKVSPAAARAPEAGPRGAIVKAFVTWTGSLTAFCDHVNHTLGIPWSRAAITRLLERHGLHAPRARDRRSGANASCGPFKTFFPGAQWVADGTPLRVRVNGEAHEFNLELVVDTFTGAIVGASLRDHEDGRGVVDAFRDAVATTGGQPLALLLDQRPCNRTEEVSSGTGDTSVIYAGRGRAQSKGHVEGAFGLFSQVRPSLDITARDPRELARELLRLVVQCWARTLNHRPRRSRRGQTRVELYGESSADARQMREARSEIAKRARRSPRRKRAPRANLAQSFIVHELARLGLDDTDGYVTAALAAHPTEAVIAGLATFQGKRAAGTLPGDADGRYLTGLVRRIAERDEGMHIAEAMWQTRHAARAWVVDWLAKQVDNADDAPPEQVALRLVDRALAARAGTERRLWIAACARVIQQSDQAHALYQRVARRIHAADRVPYSDQLACVRGLAAEIAPVA